jgi:hypothetical protein
MKSFFFYQIATVASGGVSEQPRIGLRLTLHYLGESEVDGRVIGRCIIVGGLVLRFRAWSAESAGSEELGSAGAKERAS